MLPCRPTSAVGPGLLNALGGGGCLLLVATLPGGAVVPGVLMFAIGRALARHRPW